MSERFPAIITIGGNISEGCVEGLIMAINDDSPSFEWGGADCDEDTLKKILSKDGTYVYLEMMNDKATYGEFNAIEEFCTKHQIDFDRHSEAYWEYNGERVNCRDGEVFSCLADQSGNVLVPFSQVKNLRDKIRATMGTSKRMTQEQIVDELGVILGPEIQDLKPLSIV